MATVPRRNRDYRAEYQARKRRELAKLQAEQERRHERLGILARAKRTHYVPPADTLYYSSPGQKRYWEQTYPKRIKGMSISSRLKYARDRGIDTVLPGWDDANRYPQAVSDAIAEYYLLGYMTRSRAFAAQDARVQANDLYFMFGASGDVKPNWRAFREAYSRNFNR